MAFKMNARSPLMKTLVGGQKNLPEGLKDAIEAAPESPAKNMNKGYGTPSPAKMNKGERYDMKMASDQNLKASARKNYAENAEAAQKSSPAKKDIGPEKTKKAQANSAKVKRSMEKKAKTKAKVESAMGLKRGKEVKKPIAKKATKTSVKSRIKETMVDAPSKPIQKVSDMKEKRATASKSKPIQKVSDIKKGPGIAPKRRPTQKVSGMEKNAAIGPGPKRS
jgi:hypothetical protein